MEPKVMELDGSDDVPLHHVGAGDFQGEAAMNLFGGVK